MREKLPHDKLLFALERVLVDLTNKVGVDINRAITDAYYQRLLPLVCGLGPRKAQTLVKKIASVVIFVHCLHHPLDAHSNSIGWYSHQPRSFHQEQPPHDQDLFEFSRFPSHCQ